MSQTMIRADLLIDNGKVERRQFIIFLTAIAVLIVDGFDLQIISYLMPVIVKEWGVSTQMQGVVLSAGLAGLMVGYLTLPLVAVRIGLKRMIILSLLAMSATNLLTIASGNIEQLIVLRFLTGLTLGGVFPNMVALATEYCPERYRASLVSISYVGLPVGFIIAGSASYAILPHYGWRGAMAVGGLLPILAAAILYLGAPESLEYLINRARQGGERAREVLSRIKPSVEIPTTARLLAGNAQGRSATIGSLFTSKLWLGTLALWVALTANSAVYFFVLGWMPSILTKIGATQENAILGASLANFGGIAAAFITGPLMDRYGPYRILLAHFVVGTVFAVLVGAILSPELMIIVPAALCLGFCVSGLHKGGSGLAVRFYTSDVRPVGIGWMFGVAQLGAIGGPFLAGMLFAAGWTPTAVFYLAAVPLLIGTAAITVMGYVYAPKAKGSPAEAELAADGTSARF